MWALNEVTAMVQKAARGANIPLGQAEDLGRVAAYLAGTGASVSAVSVALQNPGGQVDVKWGAARIDVLAGPMALIAPIVRDAFCMGCHVAALPDVSYVPLVLGALHHAGINAEADGLQVQRRDGDTAQMRYGAVDIPNVDWMVWSDLAARTYVPQSDASRAGAGAGLTDND